MAIDPSQDEWITPCDLCGSIQFSKLRLPYTLRARRCRACGLVTIVPAAPSAHRDGTGVLRSSLDALEQTIFRAASAGASRALLIGRPDGRVAAAVNRTGMALTVLSEVPGAVPQGVIVHTVPIEQAPFLPDQFDLIACTIPIETFHSPALMFEKCRFWLTPGGLLLVGGMNWRSTAAMLTKKSWLHRNASHARYLITTRILRRYADRFGFDVRNVQTYSRLDRRTDGDIARSSPGIAVSVAMAPFTLMASFVGMGDELYVELEKRGVGIMALPSRAKEERDTSPGLAPAMYRR